MALPTIVWLFIHSLYLLEPLNPFKVSKWMNCDLLEMELAEML
jgi:hypothetical protein